VACKTTADSFYDIIQEQERAPFTFVFLPVLSVLDETLSCYRFKSPGQHNDFALETPFS
jgi:hypothetical protein